MKTAILNEIKGICEPIIIDYFESLNAGDFNYTASLFSYNGQLIPPFESAVVGSEAIAKYLQTEAQDIKAYPQEGFTRSLENNHKEIVVTGYVKTSLFSVNVAWQFILNPYKQISTAQVKLLASLQELLSYKNLTENN